MRFGSHGNHDLQQLSLSFLYTGLNDSNDHTMVINNHDDFQTGRTELPLALACEGQLLQSLCCFNAFSEFDCNASFSCECVHF